MHCIAQTISLLRLQKRSRFNFGIIKLFIRVKSISKQYLQNVSSFVPPAVVSILCCVCLVRALAFENLDLETSFIVRQHTFIISRSSSYINVTSCKVTYAKDHTNITKYIREWAAAFDCISTAELSVDPIYPTQSSPTHQTTDPTQPNPQPNRTPYNQTTNLQAHGRQC